MFSFFRKSKPETPPETKLPEFRILVDGYGNYHIEYLWYKDIYRKSWFPVYDSHIKAENAVFEYLETKRKNRRVVVGEIFTGD